MQSWKINIFRISVIVISIIILSALVFCLPNVANKWEDTLLLIGIYFTEIPFLIAVFHLFKLLKLIEKDAVFSMDSFKHLNVISKCIISVMILYFFGVVYIYYNGAIHSGILLFGVSIIFTAFILYVLIEILKELLLKAVQIKTENEFTI